MNNLTRRIMKTLIIILVMMIVLSACSMLSLPANKPAETSVQVSNQEREPISSDASEDSNEANQTKDSSKSSDKTTVTSETSASTKADNSATEKLIEVKLCIMDDNNNSPKATYTTIQVTEKEADEGYQPLFESLLEKTGLDVISIDVQDHLVMANLSEDMKFFLNNGSTGSALNIEMLVRTILSIPETKNVVFLINGESNVEMDHYSFNGFYELTADGRVEFTAN